ncbi:nuclear transport factor 2 family protein [Streptomyces sp. BE230]|uniref:nuclear transport factor 2 family protein n=1 Tax=Streptomyces sp. BE230 TaxID=3002526 RepID=UPI002ED58F4A|nr:nuclear transport factor 2 family protein [Streptomyces sp. BE230]
MPTNPPAGSLPSGPDSAASARPGASAPQARAVWSVITGMYAAYTRQDRAAIDACLATDATIFDSAAAPLLCGKADLDRIRDERPATGEGPHETGLEAYDPVIDVFGDLALLRYWLRVDFAPDGSGAPLRPEIVRNTAVLRRYEDQAWRIVHLHEDVQQAGGEPVR